MYSQFGEDDIIDTLLGHPADGVIVDIGAGDGMEISNSRLFRERGWYTVLVEPDPRHEEALSQVASTNFPQVHAIQTAATPENINDFIPPETDVLSIDVDGDDIFLFEALDEARPKIVVVEHNPTIPYHLDVMPARLGLNIGASVAALTRVAEEKGYGLDHVTHCNAIFLHREASNEWWFGHEDELPYAVATEYFTGRPFLIGTPPWGMDFANPVPPEDVVIR